MRLDFLRPLYAEGSDYASLYLDSSRAAEDAAELVALRWRAARERLAEAGAPPSTLKALEELVTDPRRSAPGLAAFARDGTVAFAAPLPNPPRQEIVSYARLPHLMPLLADRADAALVRAAAGTGAELFFVPEGEQPPGQGIGALLRYPVPNA